jgi:hypothetical protein
MEQKLASISKRIHWSLLIRAAVFAASWWYFPAWFFVVVAVALYFIPFFESKKNIGLFLVLIGVALATPQGMVMAIVYGGLFYYLLLIKDLLVIDRKSARTIFALALTFFLFREFFNAWNRGIAGGSLVWVWIVALAFGILLNTVIVARHGKEVDTDTTAERRSIVGISSLLVAELLVVGLFLPLDFIYQSIIVFLGAAMLFDLVPAYFFGELDPRRIRMTSMTVAVFCVIVLASARWGI